MDKMIYDFKTHSFYYETTNINIPNFSLTIDTLEMVFELPTGKLIRIQGFFPIVRATICSISIPTWNEKDYILQNMDMSVYRKNEVYDLIQKIPQEKKYFEKVKIKYDKEKGIIQIGDEMKEGETGIKVNDNILCGFDNNLNLKCLYIIPTKFV